MSNYSKITHEQSMALSKDEFIARCKAWLIEYNSGIHLNLTSASLCPVQVWIEHNQRACGHDIVPNITFCEICDEGCCPTCQNHNVIQLSRVTGYIQAVSGWNEGKKQELKDRKKHSFV